MSLANKILLAALFVAAAVAGYLFYDARVPTGMVAAPHGRAVAGEAGRMRPEFTLPDLSGATRSVTEWDGQAMIVNFWATWCPPCRREIPLLIEMQETAAARGIQIVGIAMDSVEAVTEYAARTGFNYPVLVGEQEAVDAAEAYGADVIGLPLTVMTDRDGQVVEIHAGEITREDLAAAIELLGR